MPRNVMTSYKQTMKGAIPIIVLTFAVYLPAIHGGFLWDDNTLIVDNPLIRASDGLRRIWFTTEPADYYPVTNSLVWLQWRLWGNNPMGFHALNVLLHALNAVLVWTLLRRLNIPGAWWAGLIFGLHPVNAATAAWIVEQKNTLSMLFFLVSLLFYLRFNYNSRWGWYLLSLGAFFLALLSKSAVVMLPVVLLGCVWWTRRRWRFQDVTRTVPFLLLSAATAMVTISFQHRHRIALGLPPSSATAASHLAMAGSVPWFYLGKALFPFGLTLVYPEWQATDTHWTAYALGMMTISSFVLFWCKRSTWGSPFLFAFGYFVGMLFPVLGFFDQTFYRYGAVADHWQYYSIVAPIALVAAFAARLANGQDSRSAFGRMVGITVVTLLGAATWMRAGVYKDSETVWRDNAAKKPGSYIAHGNLGFAMAQKGNLKSIDEFREALRLNPDFFDAHYNLGNALAQLGRLPEAIAQLEQAVQLNPEDAGAHNNLANALASAGRFPESVLQYQATLRLQPKSADAHYNLGVALEQMGETQRAIEQFKLAIQLDPQMTDAQRSLARLAQRD